MKHVVVSRPFICPKCKTENMGACVAVMDFLVCTDCFYKKYENELQPEIEIMIREYFDSKEIKMPPSEGNSATGK